jgi:dTDP-4-amino-4,6-dideoxygalactose transaminase
MAPYVGQNGKALELPVTEELARTNLALPISPVFTHEQAEEVVAALAAA